MNIFEKSPAIYPLDTFKKMPIILISINPVGTLRTHSKCAHHFDLILICGCIENIFIKNLGFLSQIYSKCIQIMPEPLIESSFKKYLKIHSQCAHWVSFNVFKENSQWSPILPKTLNELIGYAVECIVDIFGSIFWKNSQWVAQA